MIKRINNLQNVNLFHMEIDKFNEDSHREILEVLDIPFIETEEKVDIYIQDPLYLMEVDDLLVVFDENDYPRMSFDSYGNINYYVPFQVQNLVFEPNTSTFVIGIYSANLNSRILVNISYAESILSKERNFLLIRKFNINRAEAYTLLDIIKDDFFNILPEYRKNKEMSKYEFMEKLHLYPDVLERGLVRFVNSTVRV